MSRYERFALIVDPEGAGLGVEALSLIERGIDPIFAKEIDEAVLLAEEQEERVGALVLPGTLPLAELDAALSAIVPRLWAGVGAVVVVAPPRERALLRELRDRGVCWLLYDPYDAAELRFVVAAALATEDDLDPRSGLRVPIRLEASVGRDGTTRAGQVRNLSLGGAYVALEDPPPVGVEVSLEIGLGERPLCAQGRVAHRLAAPMPGRAERVPGMGLCFAPLSEADRRALDLFIRERVDSFRLR